MIPLAFTFYGLAMAGSLLFRPTDGSKGLQTTGLSRLARPPEVVPFPPMPSRPPPDDAQSVLDARFKLSLASREKMALRALARACKVDENTALRAALYVAVQGADLNIADELREPLQTDEVTAPAGNRRSHG